MICRVYIDGYKSLRKVELVLEPLSVVIGPNAAGKSNLFDALRLVRRIVTSRSLQDAFDDHRGDPLEAFDYSECGIEGLLEKERAQFTIEVDVKLNEETIKRAEQIIQKHYFPGGQDNAKSKPRKIVEKLLRYRITVEISPRTGALRVVDERLEALKQSRDGKLVRDGRRRPFLERVGERLRLRMEGQARPMEYDTGLNYAIVSLSVHPPHYPHLIAFREEVSQWQFYYLEPRIMREESPVKEVFQIQPSGGDLAAFYYTVKQKNPAQFENIQRSLRLFIPTIESIDAELTKEGKVRLKVREGGVDFSAKVVSEGTLRILALMAILSNPNPANVVGLEEVENGVHPRRLKLIADMLRNASEKRQIMINTHSPILPDYLEDAYLVRCRKENRHTVFEPIPREEAQGLFRHAKVKEALEEGKVSRVIMRGDWE